MDNAIVSAEIVLRNSGGEGEGYKVLNGISLKLHDIFNRIAEDEMDSMHKELTSDVVEELCRERALRQQL